MCHQLHDFRPAGIRAGTRAGFANDNVLAPLGKGIGKRGGRAFALVGKGASRALLAPVLALSLLSEAWAASSFGDMADNVKDELTRFGPLLQAGFALGGFFLVGLGLWQLWAKSQQPGAPKGGAIIAILIGCGLLGAATIAQMGAGTLGTGSPELSEIGL